MASQMSMLQVDQIWPTTEGLEARSPLLRRHQHPLEAPSRVLYRHEDVIDLQVRVLRRHEDVIDLQVRALHGHEDVIDLQAGVLDGAERRIKRSSRLSAAILAGTSPRTRSLRPL